MLEIVSAGIGANNEARRYRDRQPCHLHEAGAFVAKHLTRRTVVARGIVAETVDVSLTVHASHAFMRYAYDLGEPYVA